MDHIKKIIAVVFGWLNYLPTTLTVISTLLAIVWYGMQIVEFRKRQQGDHRE